VAQSLKLQSGRLLSVQRMNCELASSLNLQIDASGALRDFDVSADLSGICGVSDTDRFVSSSESDTGVHRRVGGRTGERVSRIGYKSGEEDFGKESFERIESNRINTSKIGQLGVGFR
jgi:hypothetical protein